MNCPECGSTKTQGCGFDIESGKLALAHYVCTECYHAFKGGFFDSGRRDEEDII